MFIQFKISNENYKIKFISERYVSGLEVSQFVCETVVFFTYEWSRVG